MEIARLYLNIKEYYTNTNICVFCVNSVISPCNNCNYECLRAGVECPHRQQITDTMDRIMQADLVYYIVPNYCGFPNANYFAFNERTVGYFNLNRDVMKQYMNVKKKFIVISNTESETFYSAMQQQTECPNIFYLKTGKYSKRSIDGDILDSAEDQTDLEAFLDTDP